MIWECVVNCLVPSSGREGYTYVVESDRRHDGGRGSDHTTTNSEASPCIGTRVRRAKPECPQPCDCQEDSREHGDQAGLRLRRTARVALCRHGDQSICGEVGDGATNDYADEAAEVDKTDVCAPEVRGLGEEDWSDGGGRDDRGDEAAVQQHDHPRAGERE